MIITSKHSIINEVVYFLEGKMEKSVKDQFFKWLSKQMSNKMLSDLYIASNDVESYRKHIKGLRQPLFNTVDAGELAQFKNTVQNSKIFKAFHRKNYKNCVAFLNYYTDFIENHYLKDDKNESETKTPPEPSRAERRRRYRIPKMMRTKF